MRLRFGDRRVRQASASLPRPVGVIGMAMAVFGGVVDDGAHGQVLPPVVSNSLKSVCQTRLRTVGGSWNTLRRRAAQDLRSARNPRGSSSPRRRSTRSTVEVDTTWPSARIIAAILR
jgi:hypothetical protein